MVPHGQLSRAVDRLDAELYAGQVLVALGPRVALGVFARGHVVDKGDQIELVAGHHHQAAAGRARAAPFDDLGKRLDFVRPGWPAPLQAKGHLPVRPDGRIDPTACSNWLAAGPFVMALCLQRLSLT
jgi:hypothetical protein